MAAINDKIGNVLDRNTINKEFLRLMEYFAHDCVEKILQHIDALNVRDTGYLRSTIRSVVMANSGGNSAVVSFFMATYGAYVEQALGRYWGVDSDLKDGKGVGSENISAEFATDLNTPRNASFHGLPYKDGLSGAHDKLRQEKHKPRQFFTREINRQIERISYRLLAEIGNTMDIHVMDTIADCLTPTEKGNVWWTAGYVTTVYDSQNPTPQTVDY